MAVAQNSHTELNPIQVSLLRLFNRPMSDNETKELKKLLLDYYSDRLEQEVTKVIAEKGYSQKDFDDMLNQKS
ncbi:MAG: hypothetical protein JWR54_2024 [Mucilaginibacter sp.]|nr:hypothetical protein [Mucilaginibacter sp.]